ncbi:MAG: hypothetical protein ACFCU3_07635 [Verrucomicrobiales bacterium]
MRVRHLFSPCLGLLFCLQPYVLAAGTVQKNELLVFETEQVSVSYPAHLQSETTDNDFGKSLLLLEEGLRVFSLSRWPMDMLGIIQKDMLPGSEKERTVGGVTAHYFEVEDVSDGEGGVWEDNKIPSIMVPDGDHFYLLNGRPPYFEKILETIVFHNLP